MGNSILIPYSFSHIEIGSLQDSSLINYISEHYKKARIIILVDENTHDNCLDFLINVSNQFEKAEVILLPAGEENKVLEVCQQVWEAFSEYNFSRKDLIINLGGGVVTDMGGFIATLFKRGMDFIHIPTSLLGMVDASIGGKNGVDLGNFKNQLGTFNHPKAIFIDPQFLNTLPALEIIYGYAEMLKHALIRDVFHWNEIKHINNDIDLTSIEMLKRSVEIKASIIEEDPKEGGLRKILNFGHTIGHGIEGYFLQNKPLAHGHCVALGMCAEAFISREKGLITMEEYLDIENCIRRSFHFISLDANEINGIIKLIQQDKKNNSKEINCSLLSGIGNCIYDQKISNQEIANALFHLNLLASSIN